jgi:CubicO group peptidase (beta-lactamase class C family)
MQLTGDVKADESMKTHNNTFVRNAARLLTSWLAFIVQVSVLCANTAGASERGTALKQLIERGKATESAALIVERDGKRLIDLRSDPAQTARLDLRSATKSVVALAAGLLLQDGLLESLNTPVYRFYPEWNQGRKKLVTVRMLLNQTSGLQDEGDSVQDITAPADVVRFALAAELHSEPGEKFAPSDHGANLLAGIIGKAAGTGAFEYIDRELFIAIGIADAQWRTDQSGNLLGTTGLTLAAEDAVKLSRLLLENGRWNDRQIIPESFVTYMLNPPDSKSVEHGLYWTRTPAWIRMQVDQPSLDLLRKLEMPESMISKISALQGRAFDSSEALVSTLHKILSDTEFNELVQTAQARSVRMGTIFNLQLGPATAFSASGEGQYIVVIPSAKLLAVRQTLAPDDYEEFVDEVLDVAKVVTRRLRP